MYECRDDAGSAGVVVGRVIL